MNFHGKLLKLSIIFFIFIIAVFIALNYLLYQAQQKSKAGGESVTYSFNPSSVTALPNQDFTTTIKAKPSIDMNIRGYFIWVNFVNTNLQVKKIEYKLGTTSSGLGDTTDDAIKIAEINQRGYIKLQSEIQNPVGNVILSSQETDIASITFVSQSSAKSYISIDAVNSFLYKINTDFTIVQVPGLPRSPEGDLIVNGGSQQLTVTPPTGIPTSTTPIPQCQTDNDCPQAPCTQETCQEGQMCPSPICTGPIYRCINGQCVEGRPEPPPTCVPRTCQGITSCTEPTLAADSPPYCRPECKYGVNTFAVDQACTDNNVSSGFYYAYYICYDGFVGFLGDGNTCRSSEDWYKQAKYDCKDHSSCNPYPTSIPPTPPPEGPVTISLRLKFQGILKRPADQYNNQVIKVTVFGGPTIIYNKNESSSHPPIFSQYVNFVAGDKGAWTGSVTFPDLIPGSDYKILIKGPKHIQKKICDEKPIETYPGTYHCGQGNIYLSGGVNNLDFSGIYQLVGDLPEQDGIVNSYDVALVRSSLNKGDTQSIKFADLNLDGIVNAQDYSLVIAALSIRNDEE